MIPTGSPIATTLACAVAIPEGRLHFSRLCFNLVAGAEGKAKGCEIVIFSTYYYQASNTAAFFPTWVSAAVDCTTSPISISCFSGIGTTMVPNFPINRSLYFPVSQISAMTYEGKAANETGRSSNRWYTNNLAAGRRGANIAIAGDGYLANSMRDYTVRCVDKFYDPIYTINLTIDDDNSDPAYPGGPLDNWATSWP